jgi:hypothetical protein
MLRVTKPDNSRVKIGLLTLARNVWELEIN